MNSTTRIILAVVLVAAAGPAGFLMRRAVFGGHTPVPATVPVSAPVAPPSPGSGAVATFAPAPASMGATSAPGAGTGSAPAAPPATGQTTQPLQLPQVVLSTLDGAPRRLADYRGAPLLLNFWASWCEPCRREIPLLETLHRARSGLQVVGVAVDTNTDARRFARELGIDYPVLLGEDGGLAAIKALGADTVLPFTVFADAKGVIVAVKRGELHADEATLILGRLAALDRGALGLPAARLQISDGLRDLALARAQRQAALIDGKIAQSVAKSPQSDVN